MKAILQMVFVFLVASIGVILASTTTVDETTYHARVVNISNGEIIVHQDDGNNGSLRYQVGSNHIPTVGEELTIKHATNMFKQDVNKADGYDTIY